MKRAGIAGSRRALLTGLAAAPVLAVAAPTGARAQGAFEAAFETESARVQAVLKEAKGTRLVLLGTGGGPIPGQARRMTSHLMLRDGAAYILDCGMGVTDQFARTGIGFDAVRAIFVTHHHFDHNIEYGPFLVVGYARGLKQSVRAYGPPPLRQMTGDFLRAYRATIDFWTEDFKLQPFGGIEVHELGAAGPVMQDDHVKVTCALVRHPPVKPAYGFRFDFADRSIAFSGDTAPLEEVAQLARGAEVLVHEAMNLPAAEERGRRLLGQGERFEAYMDHMLASHTPTEEVGRIAQEAGVKTLVLSHLSPSAGVSDEIWRAAAAKAFKGEIIVGHDLMVI